MKTVKHFSISIWKFTNFYRFSNSSSRMKKILKVHTCFIEYNSKDLIVSIDCLWWSKFVLLLMLIFLNRIQIFLQIHKIPDYCCAKNTKIKYRKAHSFLDMRGKNVCWESNLNIISMKNASNCLGITKIRLSN